MTDHVEANAPPHDLWAERSVLAACMLDLEEARLARSLLPDPRAFHLKAHQVIFAAVRELAAEGVRPDALTTCDRLRQHGTLDVAGGPVALSQIVGSATGANLKAHAKIVRELHARRAAIKVGDYAREAAADPGSNLSDVMIGVGRRAAEVAALASPEGAHDALLEQVKNGRALCDSNPEPPPSLVGKGYVIRGGLTILTGMSGVGKTFLTLQLHIDLARGEPFLGHEVVRGRSGMLQLEMPEASTAERLRLSGAGPDALEAIDILTMPEGLGALSEASTVDFLCAWIERGQLIHLSIDPLNQVLEGDRNGEEDTARTLTAVKTIRRRTGVSVWFNHHPNKAQIEEKRGLRAEVMLNLRGHSRLANDPDTILGLVELHKQLLLVNAKTRHCPSVESVPLQKLDNGYFALGVSAEQIKDRNTEKVERQLDIYGEGGMTMKDLCVATGLADRTIKRALDALNIVTRQEGRSGAYRYFLAGREPRESEEVPF